MTVRFTCPRSDAIPLRQDTVVWARHGVIGGTGARSWGAYTLAGEQWAWVIRHGSGCDPRQDVDALADALADGNLATVVLAAGSDHTSEDVADAIAAELLSEFGHAATVDSVEVDGQTRFRVSIAGASAGLVGSASSSKGVTSQCGMHDGSRRDGTGPITGTNYVHTLVRAYNRDGTQVANGTRARITGVGYFGIDGFRPRLGAALGPAHSLTPADIGPIQDAGRPASGSSNGYDPIVVPLLEAIPCVIGDDAWVLVCDAGTTGSLHYRLHSSSGWHGDFPATENILIEGSRADPTVAFPASVTPTITSNFAISSAVFLVVECDTPAPGTGTGFAGNGSLWVEYGCRRDAAGETPTEDFPANETFHFRMLTPPFSRAAWVRAAQALAAVDADEDMSAAAYSWPDLDNPPASAPVRLGVSGLLGWNDGTPDTFNVADLPTRVPIGDDVVAAPYVSFGFTGGAIAGGVPTGIQIQFDTAAAEFGVDGERIYSQGASPDLLVSDFVVGGLRDLAEFVSQPTSTMPYNAPAGTWPATYDLAGTDVRPANLDRAYGVIAEQSATADVFAVETVADPSEGGVPWGGDDDGVPMSSLIDLLKGAGADSEPIGTPISVAADTDIALTPATTGRGHLLIGGGLTGDAAGTVTFYDGDPDASGTVICTAQIGTTLLPLGPLQLWSPAGSGRAVFVQADVALTGRAVAVEI